MLIRGELARKYNNLPMNMHILWVALIIRRWGFPESCQPNRNMHGFKSHSLKSHSLGGHKAVRP